MSAPASDFILDAFVDAFLVRIDANPAALARLREALGLDTAGPESTGQYPLAQQKKSRAKRK